MRYVNGYIVAFVLCISAPICADDTGLLLEELKQANQARSMRNKEKQDWLLEKEKLNALLNTLKQENQNLKARESSALKKKEELAKKLSLEAVISDEKAAVEAFAKEIKTLVDAYLKALESKTLPGIVAAAKQQQSVLRAFSDSMSRLSKAEREARNIQVDTLAGFLNGNLKSVEVLRLGGICAWWLTRDGKLAGLANVVDGKLILTELKDAGQLAVIQKAIAIAKGKQNAELIALPLDREIKK
ncbi:MAG: DUF3450 family protein [Lentisphaeria bacterium]|nr:DUF3450 domain-containing protein [Lentisphaeria bacterium]NQZ70317.1 DUF3450 family protein [Lentisphaeria bacterium]